MHYTSKTINSETFIAQDSPAEKGRSIIGIGSAVEAEFGSFVLGAHLDAEKNLKHWRAELLKISEVLHTDIRRHASYLAPN